MAGLYLHIPFCKQACHYCDFHFSTNQEFRVNLVQAIAKEVVMRKDYLINPRLQTIYFGGGTPSLLSEAELNLLLQTIKDNYVVDDEAEVTLEANPDDLSRDSLAMMRRAGINRLSIGIQSFDENVLRYLNRSHSVASAIQCVADARAEGFSNISIDLMYAIDGQTSDTFRANIAKAIALAPEHISAYSLTLEEKTVFGKRLRSGKIKAVPEESSADQFELLTETLADSGYEHYEISNFSLPGRNSRHNSNYWKQEAYLGVGPSAHSYDHDSRQANISNNALYVKAIESGNIPFEREALSRDEKINEFILTSLRTMWGCDLTKLKDQFNDDLLARNGAYVDTLLQQGHAIIKDNVLILTKSGKLLADKIASDLFAEN